MAASAELATSAASRHPVAIEHLPGFITAPGETDVLMWVMAIVLLAAVVGFGILFLRLHTLPERIAHKSHKLQFEIVAVLGLIALFTHMHIFWVIGLILALIDFPDIGGWLGRIAGSVEKIAENKSGGDDRSALPGAAVEGPVVHEGVTSIRRARARPCFRQNRARTGKHKRLVHARASGLFDVDDPPGLSLPPLCAGQAARQGDHVLLGVVRAEVGHHLLFDSDRHTDHGDLLQSPVHDQRHIVLQDRSDPARDHWARCRNLCRHERSHCPRRADLQTGQYEAAGGGGDRASQDRGNRGCNDRGAGRHPEGRRPGSGGPGSPTAGARRTGDQTGTAPAQSGHRAAARHRKAPGPGGCHPGHGRCRHRDKAGRRNPVLERAAGREGQRRGSHWRKPTWNWKRRSSVPA